MTLAGVFPGLGCCPTSAQLVGAALAAFVLLALFGMKGNLGVTVPAGSAGQAFVMELIMTVVLLLV
ncbi:aquaporin, partial [Deinococcus metalli]